MEQGTDGWSHIYALHMTDSNPLFHTGANQRPDIRQRKILIFQAGRHAAVDSDENGMPVLRAEAGKGPDRRENQSCDCFLQ